MRRCRYGVKRGTVNGERSVAKSLEHVRALALCRSATANPLKRNLELQAVIGIHRIITVTISTAVKVIDIYGSHKERRKCRRKPR